MNRSNDNGLSRAEFEYLYDTDNEEPETNQSEFEDMVLQPTILGKCQISLIWWFLTARNRGLKHLLPMNWL